jgi:hypothetical protein
VAQAALCVTSLFQLRSANVQLLHVPWPPLLEATTKPFPAAHSSQFVPEKPFAHAHVYPATSLLHEAPFWQLSGAEPSVVHSPMSVHTTLSAWLSLFCHPAAQVQVYLLSPFVHVDRPPQSTSSHSSISAHAVSSPD